MNVGNLLPSTAVNKVEGFNSFVWPWATSGTDWVPVDIGIFNDKVIP